MTNAYYDDTAASLPGYADENDGPDLPSVPVAELRGHGDGPIHIVRFTADGKYCITGAHDRSVRLWNPTRVDPAYRPPPPFPSATIAIDDDGTSSSARVRVSSQEYYGGGGGGGGDLNRKSALPSRRCAPLPSALPMQTYSDGHLHPVHCASSNASSTVLLSASDKTLLATDLVTAQTKQKWWGHQGRVEYVACLGGRADNNNNNNNNNVGEEIYASASYDGTVRLWDSRSRSKEPLMTLDHAKDAVTCVEAGGGGGGGTGARIVASSVDGKVRTYDLRTAQVIEEDVVHPVTSFSISPDGGSTIAASCLDGIVRLWGTTGSGADDGIIDRDRKRVFRKLHSAHRSVHHKVECAFGSDGGYLASGSECGAVAIYPLLRAGSSATEASGPGNAAPPAATRLRRHTGPTCSVAACPQASRPWLLVSASYDGSAVVWAGGAHRDCCLLG